MNLSNNEVGFIDSQDLLKMVNQARKQSGEKSIRNNDFINRVKDELDGETYEIFVGRKNGAEIEQVSMSFKQALRVAARESKAVRRTLVDKLESMQQPAPVPAFTTSTADTIAAGLALLDGTRKLLHISDSSVLAGLRKLQSAAGLPDLLPGYAVDAPPSATGGSSEPTSSLRQLLAEHGITLSPQKAYARLAELGIVEQKRRTSTRGEKHYWCLTAKGLEYGKNLTSPGNPRATQPHFYNTSFAKLLGKLTY
ncbi:hypothetical protein ASU80_20210 [Enterobacter hormaechei subsp. xiangfangensis]|uniref:hypothetical protein n=1 Tax=Enterobacter hormaechei TaxID=158836 RepID=UPI0007350EC9|nr:hypothetical protein [Enterobacter hormaechei]KTI13263.1 hypothetical protein ASV11_20975 [Enterobacter hormaechei subsp. xiangfangensis]KTJ63433.1 hypothetical protein ASU80_20210 [Enterobacter hormaechei subsp. xiangfangensis]MDR9967968.1 hypothetical protein [Enterobacter hormaechei subsp. xiangfangensis]